MKPSILTAAFLAAILASPSHAAERKFTSADGKELVAEIVKATDTNVTLKKSSDGKEYNLPLTRLSEDDRKFVAAWLVKQKANTRAAREVELLFENGEKKKVSVPAGQYLSSDGALTLYPGDKVNLEFEKEGDKWGAPSVVAEVAHPDRTVSFEMAQNERMTSLSRKTEIQLTVAMDCGTCALETTEFVPANIVPTEKGTAAFDTWLNGVWILRLSKFEVTDRPASEIYKEKLNK